MKPPMRCGGGLVVFALVVSACTGGSVDESDESTSSPTSSASSEATAAPTDDEGTATPNPDGSATEADVDRIDQSGDEDPAVLAAMLAESRRAGTQAFDLGLAAGALRAALQPGAMIEDQDAFTSPGGATFTYRVQDRYEGWPAAWGQIRTVEVTNPEPHTERVNGYSPGYVHPDLWPVLLDGCATPSPDGTPLTFGWTIVREGQVVVERNPAGCRARVSVPEEGRYDVTMRVRSADGWQDAMTATVDVADLVIVSLGDSAASGEGNPEQGIIDVGWVDRRCHRSTWSGHARTAEALEQRSDKSSVTFLSFACSGAQMDSGILDTYGGIAPLGRVGASSDLWEFHPLDAQIDAAREALCTVPVDRCGPGDMRPVDQLYVSVGINDLSFSTVLKICADLDLLDVDFKSFGLPDDLLLKIIEGGCDASVNLDSGLHNALLSLDSAFEPWAEQVISCHLSDAEWEERLGYVPDEPPPFCFDAHDTFGELRRRLLDAGLWPRQGVYLTTYPADPFASSRGCRIFKLINGDEARWLASWGRRLNEQIHLEAIRNGFHSVSGTAQAFLPHGYCALTRWFVRLTESILNQRNIEGTIHPNLRGHEAIRDNLLQAIAAAKPDRVPTHRATAIINRVRFDIPADATYTAKMTFAFFPHEAIQTDEVGDGDWQGDRLESVVWKRGLALPAPFDVTPGEWQPLPEPIRMQFDLAPADVWLWFLADAHVMAPGGQTMQRARPQPAFEQTPDGEPLPVDDAPGGFYRVELDATRGPAEAGEGTWVLQSEVDQGLNEGSMTVDFCIIVSPIGNTRPGPSGPGSQLGCPDRATNS